MQVIELDINKNTIKTEMKIIILLFCFVQQIYSKEKAEVCTSESCPLSAAFDYQKANVDWIGQSKPLWSWLNSQKNIKSVTFCKHDAQFSVNAEAKRPLVGKYIRGAQNFNFLS